MSMNREDQSVQVVILHSLDAVAPYREQINALNLASRRPSPFTTYEFLNTYLAHNEFEAPDDLLLFMIALRRGQLIGFLPLRSTRERAFGLPFRKLSYAALGYHDRPRVVASIGDEEACSAAFYRHLTHQMGGWDMFELTAQDPESTLRPLAETPGRRFWGRCYETDPNTTIPIDYPTLGAYYKSLDGVFRRKVTARCRRLLGSGRVEVIFSSDRQMRDALLELYLSVEARSWKADAKAGITRHPKRLTFFREMCKSPLEVMFEIIILDGVPIAALAALEFEGSWYVLESTYDASYASLAPGYLLHVLAIGEAITRQQRAFNLLHAYSYYKLSWNGVSTPTAAVQVFRVPSLPYIKARCGDLKRRMRRPSAPVQFNPARRAAAGEEHSSEVTSPLSANVALAERTAPLLESLTSNGQIVRLSEGTLIAALPFDPEPKASTKRAPTKS